MSLQFRIIGSLFIVIALLALTPSVQAQLQFTAYNTHQLTDVLSLPDGSHGFKIVHTITDEDSYPPGTMTDPNRFSYEPESPQNRLLIPQIEAASCHSRHLSIPVRNMDGRTKTFFLRIESPQGNLIKTEGWNISGNEWKVVNYVWSDSTIHYSISISSEEGLRFDSITATNCEKVVHMPFIVGETAAH